MYDGVKPPGVDQGSIDSFNFLIKRYKQICKDCEMRLLELQFWQFGVTCSNLLQIHRPPTHIPPLNKIHHSFCSFYNKICYKKIYQTIFLKCYWVPAIFLIAFTRAFAKYTPYIHLSSHLIFYASLHPSYLRKH